MAFQPGLAGSQFPGEDYILRELKDLRRAVQELSAADPFAPMGMTPSANAVTFGGSVTINGNLAVPNGSITNAALAAPIEVAQASASETNFPTALTDQNRATTTITVPAGYTRALVFCIVTAGVINSAASIDYLYLSASINGAKSRELYSQAPAGGSAPPITTSKSSLLTGLSGGGIITLAAAIHSQGNAWNADPASRAYVEAQAIFLR